MLAHVAQNDRMQVNRLDSRSFSGLEAVYRKYQITLEVQLVGAGPGGVEGETTKGVFEKIGLGAVHDDVAFRDFTTLEKAGDKEVEHFWTWVEEGDAYQKMTGANFDKEF